MLMLLWITALRPYFPYLEYQLRQEYITAKFCVNLDQPALNCKGTCHLMQRLREAAAPERVSTPSNGLSIAKSVVEYFGRMDDQNFSALPPRVRPHVHPRASDIPVAFGLEVEGPPPQQS